MRLQWDPDHDPQGNRLERRAIQLGLRDEVRVRFAKDWIVEIQDLTEFVGEQRQYAMAGAYERLVTPRESVYPIRDPQLVKRLGLDRDGCGRAE